MLLVTFARFSADQNDIFRDTNLTCVLSLSHEYISLKGIKSKISPELNDLTCKHPGIEPSS